MLNVRLDPKVKHDSEQIFKAYGLTITDAVTVFLNKSIIVGGFPFELREPALSAESREAINEARGIMNGTIDSPRFKSVKELHKEILNDE
jgi:DNA-damage-inducible protein J